METFQPKSVPTRQADSFFLSALHPVGAAGPLASSAIGTEDICGMILSRLLCSQ